VLKCSRGDPALKIPHTKIIVQGAGTHVPKSHLVSEFDRFLSLFISLRQGGHNYPLYRVPSPSCHVQNQDGGSDGAITGMISGKWGGWYGIPSRAGALWVAGMGGGVGLLAESLAELLPQARSRMTHVE